MRDENAISLALVADDFYAAPLATCGLSVIENLSPDRHLNLFVVDAGLSERNKRRIAKSLEFPNLHLHYVKPKESTLEHVSLAGSYPISVCYRLLLPSVLPRNIGKVIYLDSDLIALGNLEDLWSLDFEGTLMLAAQDAAQREIGNAKHLAQLPASFLEKNKNEKYLNSGVLVLDLEKWRREEVSERIIEFLSAHEDLAYPDQDALNIVLAGRWRELGPQWNQIAVLHDYSRWDQSPYPEDIFASALKDPHIIHYTSYPKPWMLKCDHPQKAIFNEYLQKTAWGDPVTKYVSKAEILGKRISRRLAKPRIQDRLKPAGTKE